MGDPIDPNRNHLHLSPTPFLAFFLKTELVDHEDYRAKTEAKQSLFEYIEIFYNRQRRHSYLGYIRSVEYEQKYAS